jgi:hypothetical protein
VERGTGGGGWVGAVIGQVGIGGLLSLAVWLIFTGRLVSRPVVDDIRRERDDWKRAYRESEAARAEEREQVRELLEVARVAEHVLTSLPRAGEVGHGAGSADEKAAR